MILHPLTFRHAYIPFFLKTDLSPKFIFPAFFRTPLLFGVLEFRVPLVFPHFSPENLGPSQGQPIAQPAVAGAAADLAAAGRGGHQPSSTAAAPGEAGGRGVGAVGGGDGLCQGGCWGRLGPAGVPGVGMVEKFMTNGVMMA